MNGARSFNAKGFCQMAALATLLLSLTALAFEAYFSASSRLGLEQLWSFCSTA